MKNIVLSFLTNEAGEDEGLGDAGIETFRDRPYASCAREVGQNSRDAVLDKEEPVLIRFDVIEVPTEEFPEIGKFRESIGACLSNADGEKENEFFKQAKRTIDKTNLKILRIADHNTTGLIGPAETSGTPFHSLVKSSGVSSKESATSGGSFGIGKNATFAVSDLQCVIYSTLYTDGSDAGAKFLAQGKIKLVSHLDHNGIQRRATGYWGHADGFQAIGDAGFVPEWMKREEVGTSIFAAGFRENEKWQLRMAYSILANFFCAVHRNEMRFEIDDASININSDTLVPLFENEDIREVANAAGYIGDLEFARQLYDCLQSASASESTLDIKDLGQLRLRILLDDSLPKRVGIVRNGMLITDNLENFGDQLKRFAGAKGFIAIVEPKNDEASKFLKRLENPAHNGFSAGRISDPVKQKQAEIAMRELAKNIRSEINETAGIKQEKEITLDELSRFFAEERYDEAHQDSDSEQNPEKLVYRVAERIPKRKRPKAKAKGNIGGEGGKGGRAPGPGAGAGEATGSGVDGAGNRGEPRKTELLDVRNLLQPDAKSGQLWRRIFFTPTESGTASIRFEASGVNNPELLPVVECSEGVPENGAIKIDLSESQRTFFDLLFSDIYDGPIEVSAELEPSTGDVV